MSEKWGVYCPGYGPYTAKLAIVGIAPGSEEIVAQRPFVGPSGNILRRDLKEAGVNLDDCYRTNIFKYKLPENDFDRYQEMDLNLNDAITEVSQELYTINPNCILGLGDPVLATLAGKKGKYNNIGVWRGSILQALGRKVVFTWHPAHELHGSGEGQFRPWQKYVRKFDVNRAVTESRTDRLELPYRAIQIAKSSADVYRFFESNIDEEYCAIDIESIEGIPVCIGFSFRIYEAMVVPLWNRLPIEFDNQKQPKKSYKYNLETSTIPAQDLAYIWQLLSEFFLNRLTFRGKRMNVKKIGQNFKYDEDKINTLGFYLDELYWDTMISAHCIASEMPKNLAFNTSIKTREPYYKLEGKQFVPQRDNIADFFNYCGKDCCVTREIFDHDYKELEQIPFGLEHVKWRTKLHRAYLHMDRQGFAVNEFQRRMLIHKYAQDLVNWETHIFNLCREFGIIEPINLRSHPKVNALVYDVLLGIPKWKEKGTGEQQITELLGNVIKDKRIRDIVTGILEIRRVDKTLGYLQAEPDADGRMRTTFLITGTENFRTSSNLLEPPIRRTKCGWALQTVTKHGEIGHDLRSILVADRGYVIVNIDQSQAEARVCSHLAGDEEKLLAYDLRDVHAETAAKFFKGRIEQYSKKILGYECPERFCGKTLRHAFHLGIGPKEAMINVNTDARKYNINLSISKWFAGQCLKELEKDTPKIPGVFHAEIQRLLYDDRRLHGTFCASRYFYDEEGSDLWKGGYSFVPQQTVSDKTKQVLIKIVEQLPDVKVCVESHDALAMQIREKVLDERIEQIQEWFAEPIDFSNCSIPRGLLTIPTEVEIGYNYCDLKKYSRKERMMVA
jgi:uracil-DNA glycosylase family 4